MSPALRSQQLAAVVMLFDRLTPTNRMAILQDLWFSVPRDERDDASLTLARQFAPAKLSEQWKGGAR